MAINKVTIVGMGALGVLFGDFFTRKLGKSNVEFVADEARIDKYKKEGVICNGIPCDFTVVSEDETNKPADLLIFAVKANSLNSAIKSARNKVSQDTIILSLINGISSEDHLLCGTGNGCSKDRKCINL